MDRLEAVELKFNDVIKETISFRIDSSYFNKFSISLDTFLKNKPHTFLKRNKIVSGPFGSTMPSDCYLESGGIPFIRIENIKQGFFINHNNLVYISCEDNQRIINSQLNYGDLILSKVGNTIGYFGIVDNDIKTCNISENNIGIKLGEFSNEYKYYLCTFLNCKYAKNLVIRRISGNAQPKLNVDDMIYVPISVFNNEFYEMIYKTIDSSFLLIEKSKKLYNLAQNNLFSHLGLDKYTPNTNGIAVKTFSNSFGESGRLDAEYYQPKYDEIEEKLNKYKNGIEKLKTVCKLYDQNYNPDLKKEYKYIELSNVGNMGDISDVELMFGNELPTRARRNVKTGQVIVSSIEGSLQSCALITEEYNNALCSTGFYVVNSNKINSETLLVLFKMEPIQLLLKKLCSGTILTAVNKEEFLSLPMPLIDDIIQKQIAEKIKESFVLRKKSNELLEYAKKAVEMAIEKDENTAIKWLEEQEII